MNIKQLQEVYANNIDLMFKCNTFKNIANHSNNILCDSFTNRALIYIQNEHATDVRQEDAWEACGRVVDKKAVPIGIIHPILDTKYYKDNSDEPINLKELTPDEFKSAIKSGIISKRQDIKDIKCIITYDISDTKEVIKDDINNTRKIKLSSLLNLLVDIGISVVKEDILDTTFDYNTKTLKIGNGKVEQKIETCLEALAIGMIDICCEDQELDNNIKRVAVLYSKYSVMTYFNLDITSIDDKEFNIVEDIPEEYRDTLVEILDSIESVISSSILNSGSYGIKPNKFARAALLLSILEANYEMNGLRGD